MSAPAPDEPGEIVLQGIGVSPGVAVGEAVVFAAEGFPVPEHVIHESDVPLEIARFEEALIKTRHQIAEIQRRVSAVLGDGNASIFDAHLLVVDDRYFVEEVIRELRATRRNVESVASRVAGRYMDMLEKVDDDYLRERSADVRDVTRRVIKNLSGETMDRVDQLERPCIAVARDFSPSDTAGMDRRIVHAFVTDLGSDTSHTAIMARALEVPAVVGLGNISTLVTSGETVLVDGTGGIVVIRPTSERLLACARKAEDQRIILCDLETLRDKPSETLDGYCMPIAANIELPAELDGIGRHGARGVGLFRTEFLFLDAEHLPDEEEQADVYSRVADECAPDPVVIRTLDLGGDKFASVLRTAPEINPFLGWRAIRFCLANPGLFKVQLRALLRAAAGRNLSIMYPMVSCVTEVIEANRILRECAAELEREGLAHAARPRTGVMIEVPSAALTADRIAPHVDFFSIGTNDLIQYTLAVDRVNERVAYLYRPTHAAILHLIDRVVRTAHEHRIPVTLCGQMAASPLLAPLLIGLGVDELSMSPPSVPVIKDVVRSLRYAECVRLARQALGGGTPDEILGSCRDLVAKRAPEILELLG